MVCDAEKTERSELASSILRVLGLDIGGANIKASDADGATRSVVFPMWTQHEQLTDTLREMLSDTKPDLIALTTTAELADCFASKDEGVRFVINSVASAFPNTPLRVWMTSGEFAEPSDAVELPMLVAAANWHALATWCGRSVPEGPAILVDVGSTTTDIIPLLDGFPVPAGLNDSERLQSGELVYSGSFRTPVCAITSSVELHGQTHPLAAELFATVADALIVSEAIPEDESCTDTADGRPLTQQHSSQRLARMLCCDADQLSVDSIRSMASQVLVSQQQRLAAAFDQVRQNLEATMQLEMRSLRCEAATVLISGSGSDIAKQLVQNVEGLDLAEVFLLPEMFRTDVAEAACAFAVARLAQERCSDDLIPETHIPGIGWPDNGVGEASS